MNILKQQKSRSLDGGYCGYNGSGYCGKSRFPGYIPKDGLKSYYVKYVEKITNEITSKDVDDNHFTLEYFWRPSNYNSYTGRFKHNNNGSATSKSCKINQDTGCQGDEYHPQYDLDTVKKVCKMNGFKNLTKLKYLDCVKLLMSL